MLKPDDPRQLAIDLLSRSICSVQVAAVLADKRGIFGWGWNSVGSGLGLHAEAHCLWRSNKNRTSFATLYIAAQRKRNGKVIPCMPCDRCQQLIVGADVGKVLYRVGSDKWIEL